MFIFNKLIKSVKEKITESEELISNMFSQFRSIVQEMVSQDNLPQVEAFKTFIRKLGESIDKRSNEFFQDPSSVPLKNLQIVEKSLYNILMEFFLIYSMFLKCVFQF